MTEAAYHPATHAREAEIIGRKAVDFLGKNRLALTPRNFELICAVLDGRDPVLREAFVGLQRPVSQMALSALAQRFLPERPTLDALKTTSEAALGALEAFRRTLESGVVSVAEAHGGASESLADLDAQIGRCVSALQDVFNLAAPAPQDMPGQDHLTAQLSFGLPGYGALEERLEALFSDGEPDGGVSLMLCRIEGLEPLGRVGLAKVGDYMKNTLARFTHRLIAKTDTAYWTASDELGLLVGATSESYLSQLGEKIARVVADAEAIARRSVKSMPPLACRFGCARTHRRVLPAQLYGAARQSLQRAELTESLVPIFTEVSADLATLRRYEALYGRRMR